ncbi:ABC transporter permease [Isoptericola sp. NPDC060257]|uniref:ABC transporter permease n=1 Tax=Isoptericola sp. NPDC060257 TaxID=3347087 RepID=UPI00364ADF95
MTDTETTAPATTPDTEPAIAPTPPGRKSGVRQMLPSMSGKLLAGLILIGGIVLFAIVGPFVTQDPRSSANDPLLPPQPGHWLGTTSLGYDVLAQLAEGARGSLVVGVTAGLVAIVLALLFGVVAGYLRGWTDEFLSLVTGIMLVIPGLPLMIVVASYLQVRSLWVVALILGVTAFAGPAVVLRSQARSLRVRDYVSAARVAGEKTPPTRSSRSSRAPRSSPSWRSANSSTRSRSSTAATAASSRC